VVLSHTQIEDKWLHRLATALRENKVAFLSFFVKLIIVTYQAVTTLHLDNNNIGDNGIEYLVDALKRNVVSNVLLSNVFFYMVPFLIQTLKTLALQHNQIGDSGVQYLTSVLSNNKVKYADNTSFIFFFHLQRRHFLN
jgi:hypothetical protein